MKRKVTASIVVHRTPAWQLRKALECLLASEAVERVYVIDNGPDEALRAVAEEMERVEYHHTANRGFGAGHNEAFRRVLKGDGEYHIVMNADVCWDFGQTDVPGAIAAMMDSRPDVGLVAPRVYYPDGDLQYSCRMLPTPADLFMKRFLPAGLTKKRMERYLLAGTDHSKEFNVPYLLGSFLFFRNEALRREGLFDESFFMYPEDIDITRRIHRHWRTLYWPGVSIVHEHAAASRKSGRMLRIHLWNMMKYFFKWGWIIDPERRKFNRRLLREMPRLEGERPRGRG